MTLKHRLTEDMKSALRGGDKMRLSVIRMVLAAIKQREIDERIELDDTQVLAVLDKMIKQRRDAVTQFRDAQREDLAEREEYEVGVIESYLPQPLDSAELDRLVEQAIAETGATGMREMGQVMGRLKPQIAGRADPGEVSQRVKARLAG